MLKTQVIIFISAFIFSLSAHADLASDVHALQTNWAKANYELKDENQISAFKALIKQAEVTTQKNADAAEIWIWLGIIQSTYAGKAGPFDALSYAKAAKESLEKAIEINATALKGSAYTSLGTLYFKVPGWPLGFGDNDKASALLKKAIEINPEGIDSNYFYADFLIDQDEYEKAKQHLLKAKAAPARADRPLADKGRQEEISTLLKKINKELEYNKDEINDEIN